LVRGKAAVFFATGGVVVYVEDCAEYGCAVRLEKLHCVPKKRSSGISFGDAGRTQSPGRKMPHIYTKCPFTSGRFWFGARPQHSLQPEA
jgi:hypothetical protein